MVLQPFALDASDCSSQLCTNEESDYLWKLSNGGRQKDISLHRSELT